MTSYYLGGYFLIKPRLVDFDSLKHKKIYTCSSCINDALVDNWSFTWTANNNAQINTVLNDFDIELNKVTQIRKWVDEEYEKGKIGWQSVFADLETARLYKKTFFSHLNDIQLMSVYFSETEAEVLIETFQTNQIGLYQSLIKRIPEAQSPNETLIGFDLIGIENSGDFHTFYCHNISEDLINKFHFEINSYGLLNAIDDWKAVLDYMNDEETGLEPVPWFFVKVKLLQE
ncbi:MAG: hypothetical protein JST32_05385 [Bacteroidetes bacterium]|nr:hypothetical protein [Bacteroidota bacterium]